MLSENIRNLRKQKGYSQETLAQELSVVRQTVSKWEKGYSVPDALMVEKLAELFEVSVGDLLGNEQKNIEHKSELEQLTAQLTILNDQYAREMARKQKMRKIAKWLLIPTAAIFVLSIVTIYCALFVSCPMEQGAMFGDASSAVTREVESNLFTREEIASAIDAAKNYFSSEFEGCTLIEIYYAGDEISAFETQSHECETLVLVSTFDVDSSGGDGSFNSDSTYDNWKWFMTRDPSGSWTVYDYGYC